MGNLVVSFLKNVNTMLRWQHDNGVNITYFTIRFCAY